MYKKLILLLCTASFAFSSNNSAASGNNKTAASTKADNKLAVVQKQKSTMPLDFTPLPHDVQKIVLGYLKTGWHVADVTTCNGNAMYGSMGEIYYFNDELLIISSLREITPIFFGKPMSSERSENLKKTLITYFNLTERRPVVQMAEKFLKMEDLQRENWSYNRVYGCGTAGCYVSKNYVSTYFRDELNVFKIKDSVLEKVYSFKDEELPSGQPLFLHPRFTPDERYMIHVSQSLISPNDEKNSNFEIRLIDLSTCMIVKKFCWTGETKWVHSSAISPNLTHIAVSMAGGKYKVPSLIVFDVKSGNRLGIEKIPHDIDALTFSPDSENLITVSRAGQMSDDELHIRKWEFQPDLTDLT